LSAGREAGVDIVDLAIASMSGSTSQPNLNSIVAALQFTQARHRAWIWMR
jgi:pyruvate carboxylase